MKTLKNQIEDELGDTVKLGTIDRENGFIDFQNENGTQFWAKLTKNGNRIIKHSVRLDN